MRHLLLGLVATFFISTFIHSQNFYPDNRQFNGWVLVNDNVNTEYNAFFELHKELLNLSYTDNFKKIHESSDELGYTHYKFQHYYKNIKVESSEIILHTIDGIVKKFNGKLATNLNIDTNQIISISEALELAISDYYITSNNNTNNEAENKLYNLAHSDELIIARINNNDDFSNKNYRLCYKFTIRTTDTNLNGISILIDSKTGEIVRRENLITNLYCDCCTGSGLTLFNGVRNITTNQNFAIYLLEDVCRGGGIKTYYNNEPITDFNNNFDNNHSKRVGASAQWAAAMAYDYFLETHERNSYDGNGAQINLYTGRADLPDNAGWEPELHYFGFGKGVEKASDDLVSLDIVGHEYTHAITQFTANLNISNESGALDESFSDIFGCMVEFYALGNSSGNYQISDDVWIEDGKLRDLANPNSKNDPDTYLGTHWDYDIENLDYGGKHSNNGVQNHWFYLLSEGGSDVNDNGDSYDIEGIGKHNASAIAYRNLTVNLTSASNYYDARIGSIWAAMDLFGACSYEVEQTIKAWKAVGVNSNQSYNFLVDVDCSEFSLNSFNSAISIDVLESSCTLPIPYNIEFVSYNEINLKPGFKATHSAGQFTAYIEECPFDYSKSIEIGEEYSTLESEIDSSFTIYPNPSSDFITINTKKKKDIYNVVGEKLFSTNEKHVDISHLPSGVYIVFINGVSKRFVKQ